MAVEVPGTPVGAGRNTDVFDIGGGRVLRRYRDGREARWVDIEAQVMTRARASGVPVRGFTWYSLTDQIDWQHALRVRRNDVHSVGLYDLHRRLRPVGRAYQALIASARFDLDRQSVA